MTQFVIGIGSQRAGSTLLHRVLEQCSPIYMNPVKELHYFDTLFNVRNESVLKHFSVNQLNREIERIVKAEDYAFINKRFKNALRTNFLLATKPVQKIDYIDLFRPVARHYEMLGEITPEYMILPEEGIRKMREVVGENAKILLLARNPVKRFVSAFKLLMHGLPNSKQLVFEEEMLKILDSGGEWMRVQDALNDYETALTRYQQEFPHVLMLSHDALFGAVEETAALLSEFLETQISVGNYRKIVGTKVNALDDTKELSDGTITVLETRYSENQRYLNDVFGKAACIA
ncbi:MAG: sulfotransferase [Methylovulum sp.]|nr:sulfotransferase [Methylovulum sp.]